MKIALKNKVSLLEEGLNWLSVVMRTAGENCQLFKLKLNEISLCMDFFLSSSFHSPSSLPSSPFSSFFFFLNLTTFLLIGSGIT